MFLLVSGRHVGAHLDGHQLGFIDLGKRFLCISLLKRNCCDLNLGEGLCIFTFYLFPDSGLNLLNCFDFYFDLFVMA